MFDNIIILLSQCTIEPEISSTGEYIYPDLNTYVDRGVTINPADCKLRFVKRENRIII
jgi:hypothetical protein